jgi:hypothetical protein
VPSDNTYTRPMTKAELQLQTTLGGSLMTYVKILLMVCGVISILFGILGLVIKDISFGTMINISLLVGGIFLFSMAFRIHPTPTPKSESDQIVTLRLTDEYIQFNDVTLLWRNATRAKLYGKGTRIVLWQGNNPLLNIEALDEFENHEAILPFIRRKVHVE